MKISVELHYYKAADGMHLVKLVFHKRARARHTIEGVRVTKEQWDKRRGEVKFGVHGAAEMNALIEADLKRARLLALTKRHLTPAGLRDAMKIPDTAGRSFLDLALLDLAEAPPKSVHTRKKRKKVIERFGAWAGAISAEEIDGVLVERYYHHLKKGKLKHNSIAGDQPYLTAYVQCSSGDQVRLVSGNAGGHILSDGAVLAMRLSFLDTTIAIP